MKQFSGKCKWVLAFLLVCSCVHTMQISQQSVEHLDRILLGKTFWLAQSLYSGTFYDDERYFLLNPRPFDEIDFIAMPDGKTIIPPPASSVIPVGTKVTVTQVEWPVWQSALKRPLMTPRHLTWIKMKVAKERGDVSVMRDKTFIILVPFQGAQADLIAAWFKTIFSENDTNPWFLSQKPEIQKAIAEKKAMLGMSKQALIASLGDPDTWHREFIKETAKYQRQVVTIENDLVLHIQAR